jgi:hypothetical protein
MGGLQKWEVLKKKGHARNRKIYHLQYDPSAASPLYTLTSAFHFIHFFGENCAH